MTIDEALEYEKFYQAQDPATRQALDDQIRQHRAAPPSGETKINSDIETKLSPEGGAGKPPAAPEAPPPGDHLRIAPAAPEPARPPAPDIVADPHAGKPAAPGKVAVAIEATGKGLLVITVLDGVYRDLVKIWNGGVDTDPGLLGPALQGTWVGDALQWVNQHSPTVSGWLHDIGHYSHTAEAIAGIPLFFAQLGEVALEGIGVAITAVVDAFSSVGAWAAEQIEAAVSALTAFAQDLATVIEAFGEAAHQAGLIILDALGDALVHIEAGLDAAVQTVGDLGANLANALPAILDSLEAVFDAGTDLAADAVTVIAPFLLPGNPLPVQLAQGAPLQAVQDDAVQLTLTLVNAANTAGNVVDQAIDTLAAGGQQVAGHLANAANAVGNGLAQAGDRLEQGWNDIFN